MSAGIHFVDGWDFEKHIFGRTAGSIRHWEIADLNFDDAIEKVIEDNWLHFAEAIDSGAEYCHNPTMPKMGKTLELWRAVRRNLPNTMIDGRETVLNLYVAFRSSLDVHYGIDAFFWWDGVYVTLDASLRQKEKGEEDPYLNLKADILIPREAVSQSAGSGRFGMYVANLLKARRDRFIGSDQRISKARFVLV